MRAAFLGPAGTYSHEALVGDPRAAGWDPLPLPTVFDAVLAVEEGTAERALVPIENSLEGAVGPTLDALAVETERVRIVGEVVHPIRHALIAREPLALEDVRVVLSHPQANAQCARFIRAELPGATVLAVASTAEAVRLVA
jgi:prephenate dehydratase